MIKTEIHNFMDAPLAFGLMSKIKEDLHKIQLSKA
jgi:hypothetical protein